MCAKTQTHVYACLQLYVLQHQLNKCVCHMASFQAPQAYPMTPPQPQQPLRPPPASMPSQQPRPAATQSLGTIDRALRDYDHKIVCPQCLMYDHFPGRYRYVPTTHTCEENVLAVKKRNDPNARWLRVRERTNHRDFPGKYIICNSINKGDRNLCRYGEGKCSFAHNEVEQCLWGLEKVGRFSVTEFILQNRNATSARGSRGYTVAELLKKYRGTFTYVCRSCYFGRPPCISRAGPNNCCSGEWIDSNDCINDSNNIFHDNGIDRCNSGLFTIFSWSLVFRSSQLPSYHRLQLRKTSRPWLEEDWDWSKDSEREPSLWNWKT